MMSINHGNKDRKKFFVAVPQNMNVLDLGHFKYIDS